MMKTCIILMLLFFSTKTAFGLNFQDTVYVSSSMGDDNNDGHSESSPLRTVQYALEKGDIVLLKSGDVFYEGISLENDYVSSYGEGTRPVLSGYKRFTKQAWQQVSENIWKTSLIGNYFSGKISYGASTENNIGCIHDYQADSIHGRKVCNKEDLKEDWDLWQTSNYKNASAADFNEVYLFLRRNPNKLCLEFSTGIMGVVIANSTLENVRIEGFGCHGIAARTHSVIRNCEVDAIGGETQVGYEVFTSLGNGIEFYVNQNIEDCLVEHCKITRCYDCGITIQASDAGKATPRNIIIQDNLIMDCCQGWEDFLRNDENVLYENCVFQNNRVLNSGLTSGFGYPERFKFCHILGNNFKGDKGMIIRNNVFVGGNYYCSGEYNGTYKSNIWQGNTCYIKRGDFILGHYLGAKDVIRIPIEKGSFRSLRKATESAINKYRELTGDRTTRFIIEKEKKINRRLSKMKKQSKKEWKV